jgi:hypothetical protein
MPTTNSRERESDNSSWGHKIKCMRNPQTVRLGFQNINGLPINNNLKSETLIQVIQDYNFSYFGIQEINIHERLLPPSQKWKRKFPYIHTQSATNQHSPSLRRILHGGTAHFLDSDFSLRQIDHGQDPTNLGRWIWTLLRGRQGIQVRIISGYRPIEDNTNRPYTVFSQQEHYFNTIAIPSSYRNPRRAFYEDLDVCMRQWIDAGDLIILGLDANEDVHTGETREWITSWGLADVLATMHPHLDRVATCSKNHSCVPIDGFWASPSLQIEASGMTGFGELYPDSDHRILWADIKRESFFGFMAPAPDKRPDDSLPIKNPIAMRKYNKYVRNQFEVHRIKEKTFYLEQKAIDGEFGMEDAIQYNRILTIQQDIRRRARRRCRRFYTSQILYTDALDSRWLSWHMVRGQVGGGGFESHLTSLSFTPVTRIESGVSARRAFPPYRSLPGAWVGTLMLHYVGLGWVFHRCAYCVNR